MDSSSLQSSSCQTRRSEDKAEGRGGAVEEDRGMEALAKKEGPPSTKQKCSKEVYFSVLPDKYEPLIEEVEEVEESAEEKRRRKEEKKKKKKQRYKKYRKNVGKALRFSWRCLLAALQNMTSAYTTPLSVVSTTVMEIYHSTGNTP